MSNYRKEGRRIEMGRVGVIEEKPGIIVPEGFYFPLDTKI